MRFEHPLFLFVLAAIPLLYRFSFREAPRRFAALKYTDLKSLGGGIKTRRGYRGTLFALRAIALVLIALALARPQLETSYETAKTEGIDIMLGLDISGSMRAEDFKPNNRLYVAKQVVSNFVSKIPNDRVGLVVFASKSFTRCPLTLDHRVLRSMLEDIQIGMIDDGTAIGLALATCVARLKDSQAKSKVIILLTDGVNNQGEIDPITGASLARAAGIRTYTIGVGKEGGAPVPVPTQSGRMAYARNPDGSLYMTELDEDTLKEIAAMTGGTYYRATDEKALDEIYKKILDMERTAFKVKQFKHKKELAGRIMPFAALALFLEILLVTTIWRRIP
ncbi:MAG: VWA domain-containing protein [bacterium]|jgi:Ca-activated chloride channel family protein